MVIEVIKVIEVVVMKKIFSFLLLIISSFLISNSMDATEKNHYRTEAQKYLSLATTHRKRNPQKAREYLKIARENLDIANALKSESNHGFNFENYSDGCIPVSFVKDPSELENILEAGVVTSSTFENDGETLRLKVNLASQEKRANLQFYQKLTSVLEQQSAINASQLIANKQMAIWWENKNRRDGYFKRLWKGFKKKLEMVTTVVIVVMVGGAVIRYILIPTGLLGGATEALSSWMVKLIGKVVSSIGPAILNGTLNGVKATYFEFNKSVLSPAIKKYIPWLFALDDFD